MLAFDIRSTGSRVELSPNEGEWVVRVIESGQESVRTFVMESYALAYAEGQRMRLGLEGFERAAR